MSYLGTVEPCCGTGYLSRRPRRHCGVIPTVSGGKATVRQYWVLCLWFPGYRDPDTRAGIVPSLSTIAFGAALGQHWPARAV